MVIYVSECLFDMKNNSHLIECDFLTYGVQAEKSQGLL